MSMKKVFVIVLACLIASVSANAQTQKKYMLQQIAALQVYIGYAKKGYNIASKGINTVRNIKNGDFNLHRDFFSSLKNVNPKISKYVKVADIIAYQIRIVKNTKQTLQIIRETKQFTTEELEYCKKVFDNLLDQCVKTIDELLLVTTPGKLEMKDDERLKKIDRIYSDMQDKYSFCSSFSDEMGMLALQRLSEQTEITQSKILNGIK